MPLLLWPFPSGAPPTPGFIRALTGKVLVLDSVHNQRFGKYPVLDESCALVLNVGPGVPRTFPVIFTFTTPAGTLQVGDVNFAYVNPVAVTEPFPLITFPAGETLVYLFGVDELGSIGTWSVQANIGGWISDAVSFRVLSPRQQQPAPN